MKYFFSCDNFYNFACGNYWDNRNLTKPFHEFSEVYHMNNKLRQEISEIFNDVEEIEPFILVKNLYQSCVDIGKYQNYGGAHLCDF